MADQLRLSNAGVSHDGKDIQDWMKVCGRALLLEQPRAGL